MKPVKNTIYDLREVEALDLLDSPCLMFICKDGKDLTPDSDLCYVQTAHLTSDALLALPGWANTWWEYLYTTSEWIPVFRAVSPELVRDLCEVRLSRYGHLAVYPKGSLDFVDAMPSVDKVYGVLVSVTDAYGLPGASGTSAPCGYCGSTDGYSADYPGEWESCNSCNGV